MSTTGNQCERAAVTAGSIIHSIGAERPTRTATPQIDMEERLVAIPSATVKRMHGRIRVNGMTGSETARRTEVPGTDSSRETEEGQAGNRRARRIEAAEEQTA